MEKEGIGRPSTYSIVIRNLLDKTYIVKEKGNIIPTNNGFTVIDFLEKNFPNIVNIKFTANLENDLDSIKNGEENKKNIINKIYIPLTQQLENINKEKIGLCPECGHELKYKRYKTKYFIGCSNYPECKYIKKNEIKK